MSAEERWRPVVGYEGQYEVSDRGSVRSIDRIVQHAHAGPTRRKGRVLRLWNDYHGYPTVKLNKNNRGRTLSVHRLVAEAFIGPMPEGQEVRHLDGQPTNNRLSNLAYGTHLENMADRLVYRTTCRKGHDFTAENTRFTDDGGRRCRACAQATQRRKAERAKARQRLAAASREQVAS